MIDRGRERRNGELSNEYRVSEDENVPERDKSDRMFYTKCHSIVHFK